MRDPELPGHRDAEGVRLSVQVQARNGDVSDFVVEDRPGLPGKYGDFVPQLYQLPGQVTGVHTLATRMRVAAIHQQGDPQGSVPDHEVQTVVGAEP